MSLQFLLDTDTCVFWLRGREAVRQRVLAVGPAALGISIVTLAELAYGAACSAQPAANQQAVDDFVSAITVLPVDPAVALAFGAIKAALRAQGHLLEDIDLFIGATAQVHGLPLVTGNVSHFQRIPDLRLEHWG